MFSGFNEPELKDWRDMRARVCVLGGKRGAKWGQLTVRLHL
jgi:hypothetical protein